jgi:amino acid transporter
LELLVQLGHVNCFSFSRLKPAERDRSILPAELSAAAVLINYWNKTVSNGVWITICLIVVVVINFLGAGMYGEAEFWFASIKVLTITGLIILGIIISAGGGPEGEKIGFKYWKDPGAFNNYADIPGSLGKFLGYFAVLVSRIPCRSLSYSIDTF